MAHFTEIALPELLAFFQFPDGLQLPVPGTPTAKGWVVPAEPLTEWAFDFPVGKQWPGVYVRVLSSVSVKATKARSVGADAIRVFAVDLAHKNGVVKATRVHRVEGWRANLTRAVKQTWHTARERMAWLERTGRWTRPEAGNPVTDAPLAATAAAVPSNEFVPAGSTKPNELF